MRRFHFRAAIALSLCMVTLGLVGSPAVYAQATAQVRAVHVATGAPAVDISIAGARVFSDLAPRSASGYNSVPAGRQTVRISVSGQPDQTVLETDLDLQPNTSITLAVVGEVPSVDALVLTDDNAPPPTGQAKVRFVHGAPDVPPVDVATRDGQTLFGGIAYRTAADYVHVPAGTYDLEIRAADNSSMLVTLPNVTLSASQIVTFFATGRMADNQVTAVPVTYQAGGTSSAGGVTGDAGNSWPTSMPRAGTGPVSDGRVALFGLPAALAILVAGLSLRRASRRPT